MQTTFTHQGFDFIATFEPDDFRGYPWEECDGHGPVRKSSRPHRDGRSDKSPGERPLNSPDRNEYQFYYDWQAAVKLAQRDGWNAEPYDAPNRVARAVQADFDFLRGFLNGDWQYLAVTVEMRRTGERETVCGVESFKDFHEEFARELAEGLIAGYRADLKRRSNEKRERAFWASRDVATI